MPDAALTKGKLSAQLQQLLIIFLILMLVLVAGAFILKSSLSERLGGLDRQLTTLSGPTALDSALLAINSAENDFQQACMHNDAAALAAYKARIVNSLTRVTASMQQSKPVHNDSTALTASLRQKMTLSQQFFRIRQEFDSLLNVTNAASLGLISGNSFPAPAFKPRLRSDTTVSTKSERSKAGLFSRMKNAIRNKNQVKVLTVHEQPTGKMGKLSPAQQATLQQAVQQLKRQYGLMGASGQQLITVNLRMLSELRQFVEQIRGNEAHERQKLRNNILTQYRETSDLIDKFTTTGLIVLLIFTVLLIYYVKKTISAEKGYLGENERAVELAAQKSEILAIMSHEVRNKLTAINGAVFMLKRSELSPVQSQKVESVGYASSLLLETVNNVLDVSKIEYGSSEVLKIQSFRPLEALREAVEALRFSAEKNGLEIELNLTGDPDQQVMGDALRLKQIVINLVGNAIKFTKTGSIAVSGTLAENILRVSVRDTGIGIAEAEQDKLFKRYYQGGKNSHKPGTGLGLYLCRHLVEMQGGSISLKSKIGEGSTVEFNIPYRMTQEQING